MMSFYQRNKASYILSAALSFRSTGYVIIQRHVLPLIVRAGIFLLPTASGPVRGHPAFKPMTTVSPFARGYMEVTAMGN